MRSRLDFRLRSMQAVRNAVSFLFSRLHRSDALSDAPTHLLRMNTDADKTATPIEAGWIWENSADRLTCTDNPNERQIGS